jgi:hypothetical protein
LLFNKNSYIVDKKAPSSLLEALESHVNGLEGKKGGTNAPATTQTK